MRVAVAGLGNAATTLHLPALRTLAGSVLVAGCDPSEESRARAGALYGFDTCATLAELLKESRPDVVLVCAPPRAHGQLVLESLAAGAHVICEKPLATSVAEARELVAAAEKSGRKLAMNHEFREMPGFRGLLDRLGSNGRPVFAQAWQNMDLPPWAEPGWRGTLTNGVLYEAGIHLVDYILAAFGETPRRVSATMSACGERDDEPCDAAALVTLEFSDRRLAQVTQNRFCKGETQYFEVRIDTRDRSGRVSYGGRARVSAGLLRSRTPHLRVEFGKSGLGWEEQGHARHTTAAIPGNAPMVATANLLRKTIAAFGGAGDPPAPAAAGLDVLRVLAACYLSADRGRRYDLETDAAEIEQYRFE
ncbi:MAG: Gfo/Idh/MocA family oxidoreductase [Gemmatimonadota bacterium]